MSSNDDVLMSTEDLAKRWRTTVRTILLWRQQNRGPPFIKLGKFVRYRLEDILKYEKEKTDKPERKNK